jgi:hypothetical protein
MKQETITGSKRRKGLPPLSLPFFLIKKHHPIVCPIFTFIKNCPEYRKSDKAPIEWGDPSRSCPEKRKNMRRHRGGLTPAFGRRPGDGGRSWLTDGQEAQRARTHDYGGLERFFDGEGDVYGNLCGTVSPR